MRAIVMTQHGGPEVLETRELPDPVPGPGEVLIRVRAFGLNHADTYMRSGVWSFGIPVLGIECVGVVEQDPGGRFGAGATVVALVGRPRAGPQRQLRRARHRPGHQRRGGRHRVDLGRSRRHPRGLRHRLDGAARQSGRSTAGRRVLVRGATSAVGQAAVNLAVDAGATVIATTRAGGRVRAPARMGAAEVLIDDGRLAPQIRATHPRGIDAVLDLVGNSVLRDSLQCVAPRGRVVPDRLPRRARSGGGLQSAGGPAQRRRAEHLRQRVRAGRRGLPDQRRAPPGDRGEGRAGRVLRPPGRGSSRFDEIVEAHRVMDSGEAGGKLVVTVEGLRRLRGERQTGRGRSTPRGRIAPYTTITRPVIRCLGPSVKRQRDVPFVPLSDGVPAGTLMFRKQMFKVKGNVPSKPCLSSLYDLGGQR